MSKKIINFLKKKRKISSFFDFLLFFIFILSIFSISIFALNTISTGYKTSTSTLNINAWSNCREVKRISGNDVFVPTKTSLEWAYFISGHPSNISVNDCGGGGGGGGGTATNGQCALNHYNCNSGTSVNNSDNANDWTWTCQGINGGYNDNCSENKVASCYSDGVCSSSHYGCNFSYSPSNTSETSSQYSWTCSKNGCSSFNCTENKPAVNGSCGVSHYSCNSGTSVNNSDNANDWTWTCQGSNGGSDALCSETKNICAQIQTCYPCGLGYCNASLCSGSYSTCTQNGTRACDAANNCDNGDYYCYRATGYDYAVCP